MTLDGGVVNDSVAAPVGDRYDKRLFHSSIEAGNALKVKCFTGLVDHGAVVHGIRCNWKINGKIDLTEESEK